MGYRAIEMSRISKVAQMGCRGNVAQMGIRAKKCRANVNPFHHAEDINWLWNTRREHSPHGTKYD